MNYDITMCSGEDFLHKSKKIVCDKKDSCHRHIAWLDLMKSNESIMVSMTFPADCINNNYNLYWEDKQ